MRDEQSYGFLNNLIYIDLNCEYSKNMHERITVDDYIKINFNGSKTKFAEQEDTSVKQVNRWIAKGAEYRVGEVETVWYPRQKVNAR